MIEGDVAVVVLMVPSVMTSVTGPKDTKIGEFGGCAVDKVLKKIFMEELLRNLD